LGWADLAHCLEATRWPDELEGAGWEFGSNLGYIRSLADYRRAMAMTGGARKQL
jgi:microsomal epoxide hydrolase